MRIDLYDKKRLGIYVHVPFCASKCAYCDFNSFVPDDGEIVTRYVDALCAQIDARDDLGKTSPLDLNGQPFAAFIAPGLNASGCATLRNGEALTFLFTPQDDSQYMLTVAEIMASYRG